MNNQSTCFKVIENDVKSILTNCKKLGAIYMGLFTLAQNINCGYILNHLIIKVILNE